MILSREEKRTRGTEIEGYLDMGCANGGGFPMGTILGHYKCCGKKRNGDGEEERELADGGRRENYCSPYTGQQRLPNLNPHPCLLWVWHPVLARIWSDGSGNHQRVTLPTTGIFFPKSHQEVRQVVITTIICNV